MILIGPSSWIIGVLHNDSHFPYFIYLFTIICQDIYRNSSFVISCLIMEKFTFFFDYEQFVDILAPIIDNYGIQKNERLTTLIKECYGRLKEININDLTCISLLINKLIETITRNKLDHEQSCLVDEICHKIIMKFNEMEKEMENLQEKNAAMIKEVNNLHETNALMKKEMNNLQKTNVEMDGSFQSLKIRMDISECYNYSFDLVKLFVFYYIEPLLKNMNAYKPQYKDWNLMKNEISVLKRKLKNNEINEIDLENFVNPLQNELNKINVNILNLHDLIQQRHTQTHQSIRSKEEQEDFLDILENFKFSDKFIHRDLVVNLFNLVRKQKLKRYVN
ncbi:unnamed protein product [Rotaria socialis]|uniref:Uncharacterized protein n=2 Tax=Rotaria socialis TaxID=392032 RepID=A0A818C6N8_9BILA|nr:unnamed protein product [Rotaria socialis]